MPVKSTNNARKFVEGRIKKAKQFVFTGASIIKASAQQYAPLDTGALQNSSPISQAELIGETIVRSTLQYLVEYAKYLHDPKPGGKLDGWQPQTPEDRAMKLSAQNYPSSGVSGGFNPSAQQGWIYLGEKESRPAVEQAFKDIMRI